MGVSVPIFVFYGLTKGAGFGKVVFGNFVRVYLMFV